jgi:hypothetical protein
MFLSRRPSDAIPPLDDRDSRIRLLLVASGGTRGQVAAEWNVDKVSKDGTKFGWNRNQFDIDDPIARRTG